jgi:ribosomal protein L28
VTGEWRRVHNEKLYDLYCSPNVIRVIKSRGMRWARHVAFMEETRGAYRVLVGRPERKRPLGRTRRRWEDNLFFSLLFRPNQCKIYIYIHNDFYIVS